MSIKKIFALAVVALVIGCQQTAQKPPQTSLTQKAQVKTKELSLMEKNWGIKVQSEQLLPADYMFEFSYQVTDPEKATSLLKHSAKTYLTDQKSGIQMRVPVTSKVGPMRSKTMAPKSGQRYFILFANPGRYIKAGNKVTVAIGDYKMKNIVVQ